MYAIIESGGKQYTIKQGDKSTGGEAGRAIQATT